MTSPRFAYADPPYLGCGHLYNHPDSSKWDSVDAHHELLEHLDGNYVGWAMSLSAPSLPDILPKVPVVARVAAWVKPFAIFKPNVNPGYSWEPVVFKNGRRRRRQEPTIKDHLVESITLQRGLVGVKPHLFNLWVLDLIGWQPGDLLDDLFPGSDGLRLAAASEEHRYMPHGMFDQDES